MGLLLLFMIVAGTILYIIFLRWQNTHLRTTQDIIIEEIDWLMYDIRDLGADNRRLRQQLEAAERNLRAFHNQPRGHFLARHIRINGGRYLRLAPANERGWVEYIHIIDDLVSGEGLIIVFSPVARGNSRVWRDYTHAVSQPCISPCGNLLIFVQIVEEWHDGVIIYDMQTGTYRSIPGLRAHWDIDGTQSGPRDAIWLDERTLLILIKHIHGTPLRGGTLYALDIYDNTLTSLDVPLPAGGQIFSVQGANGVVYMNILVDMYNVMLFNTYPHSISFAEAHGLIAAGETRAVGTNP